MSSRDFYNRLNGFLDRLIKLGAVPVIDDKTHIEILSMQDNSKSFDDYNEEGDKIDYYLNMSRVKQGVVVRLAFVYADTFAKSVNTDMNAKFKISIDYNEETSMVGVNFDRFEDEAVTPDIIKNILDKAEEDIKNAEVKRAIIEEKEREFEQNCIDLFLTGD